MFDAITHRWLRIPYTLTVRYIQRPRRHPRATIVFIHGIGNTGDAWRDVIAKLPSDVRIIAIDLLGFGDSAKPDWATYNAKTQARSVVATYLSLGLASPAIIVGHSLGSLVAIEIAKRYPLLVRSLILCSPPLYKLPPGKNRFSLRTEDLLRQLYNTAYNRPDDFLRLSAIAMKYNLINRSFNVTSSNVASYMATLRAAIINQTSFADAHKLTVPTSILYGTLDPVVIGKNLKQLADDTPHIALTTIIASHEVRGRYVTAVVKAINNQLPPSEKHAIKKK